MIEDVTFFFFFLEAWAVCFKLQHSDFLIVPVRTKAHLMHRFGKARRVQCDEIWSFVYAKKRNVADAKAAPDGAGDAWTWTAIDSETKLILSYVVGKRDADCANIFMRDVAHRLANRVQLTTDNLKTYLDAVEDAFGGDIDYAKLIKLYGEGPASAGRYSPAICTGTVKERMMGNPDKAHISTSHVERQNLTMRISMRRFDASPNAF